MNLGTLQTHVIGYMHDGLRLGENIIFAPQTKTAEIKVKIGAFFFSTAIERFSVRTCAKQKVVTVYKSNKQGFWSRSPAVGGPRRIGEKKPMLRSILPLFHISIAFLAYFGLNFA